MATDPMDADDASIDLTLSERVARAKARPDAVSLGDGTIIVELSLHRLEPSALPRPNAKRGLFATLRRKLSGAPDATGKVRYVKTRHGDADPR